MLEDRIDWVCANLRIPRFLLWAFRPFIVGNPWSERLSDLATVAIEEGNSGFRDAELYIENMEELDGYSTETIKLATRIERYRILGRYHTKMSNAEYLRWYSKSIK